jgi:hypothetical protein
MFFSFCIYVSICFNICFRYIAYELSLKCYFSIGHELKGLKGYFGWFFNRGSVGTVSFPLTTIIDFKGYRITAMTKLPINGSETLVYGSDDAGTECHVRNLMPGNTSAAENNLKSCFQIYDDDSAAEIILNRV